MSFAATAALVGAYAGWSDYRADRPIQPPPQPLACRLGRSKNPRRCATGLAVTSLDCRRRDRIYAAWHFQQVSLARPCSPI